MILNDFASLIRSMPVAEQAFWAKRQTWLPYIEGPKAHCVALSTIFGQDDRVMLSRADLRRYAAQGPSAEFVMATILWGYPSGMRGNHVQMLIAGMDTLLASLSNTKMRDTEEWTEHWRNANRIAGLGLSTYTKFMSFLGSTISGMPALILDERVTTVVLGDYFDDFEPLRTFRSNQRAQWYPEYLAQMKDAAASIDAPSENLEMFLFLHGLNLKK